jgi:hypothetical protein
MGVTEVFGHADQRPRLRAGIAPARQGYKLQAAQAAPSCLGLVLGKSGREFVEQQRRIDASRPLERELLLESLLIATEVGHQVGGKNMHCSARWGLILISLIAASTASAASLDGSYVAAEQASLAMTLQESADGSITGTLTEPGTSMPLQAHRAGDAIAGTIGSDGGAIPFTATISGQQVIMEIGAREQADRVTFTRVDAAPDPSKSAPGGSPQGTPRSQ